MQLISVTPDGFVFNFNRSHIAEMTHREFFDGVSQNLQEQVKKNY